LNLLGDRNSEAAQHYSVSAMPTFLLIKGGAVVDKVTGADINSLKSAIQKHQ